MLTARHAQSQPPKPLSSPQRESKKEAHGTEES
jgi:hypothetical protein